MSRYLEILAVQRPFPFDQDDSARVMFSVNFDALAAAPVTAWEEELAKLINTAGLGTRGTDLFIGPAAVLPADHAGPLVSVIDTGGSMPEWTHQDDGYERLSAQIVVRAASYVAARTRALAIWRVLDGVRNTTVVA